MKNRLTQILMVILLAAISSSSPLGCSSKKKTTHTTDQVAKCFTARGCAASCGNQAHFQTIQSQLMNPPPGTAAGGNGYLGDALGSLSATDQTCYLCASPCLQAGAASGVGPGGNALRTCPSGTYLRPGLTQPTVPVDCIPVINQQAVPPPNYYNSGGGFQPNSNIQGGQQVNPVGAY